MARLPRWRVKTAVLAWSLVAVLVIVVILANVHFVYVAVKTQPDCVAHLKTSGKATGSFRAATSAC